MPKTNRKSTSIAQDGPSRTERRNMLNTVFTRFARNSSDMDSKKIGMTLSSRSKMVFALFVGIQKRELIRQLKRSCLCRLTTIITLCERADCFAGNAIHAYMLRMSTDGLKKPCTI